ncbi:MAG TPA: hypothetical protein VHB98_03020 [Chloroflexota bacterium]|nr:hypothetical protein [Chloroflexota bacterium]
MSFLDRLLGTSKPVKSKTENLFAMSTAIITLQTSLHLEPTNEGMLCFKAIDSLQFEELKRDMGELLRIRANDTASQMSAQADEYGFQWAVLRTKEFEDLVTTIHMLSEELKSRGFGEQLLASVFRFRDEQGRSVFWVYNYKRGAFYPFVPKAGQQRDNAYELRLATLMERELPMEKELERWYAIWGIPTS